MQRRIFIKNMSISAVAVSASGFVRFDGNRYTGDCETTSDILGPFYRPNSPKRNNLLIPGENGHKLELTGIIKHNDCITPYKNAKIELWHCDSNGIYDNTTDDFRYRGTTYSGENGQYSFKTILPVPYDVGNGQIRPAHFHLMITAEGYQPLITQLYFSGDEHIVSDLSASSPTAKRRILEMQEKSDNSSKVQYDVSMSPKLMVEPVALDKLTGTYEHPTDKNKKLTLFKNDQSLWMKNEVFGISFLYVGNNTFEYPGSPDGTERNLQFKTLPSGVVQLTLNYIDDDKITHQEVYKKVQ